MPDLITREWNNTTIRQREDGYINATDMCTACNKRFSDWYRLNSTSAYLEALEGSTEISVDQLIQIVSEGTNEQRGTWVHRKVALRLAQWLSPEFAVQVDAWIEELMENGKVELQDHPEQKPQTQLDILNQMLETFNAQQKQIDEVKGEVNETKSTLNEACSEIEDLKQRIENYRNDPNLGNAKFNIDQFCRIKGIEPTHSQSVKGGHKLTKLCRLIDIDFNDNPQRPNDYPYWLLEALFDTAVDFEVNFNDLIRQYLLTIVDE